MEVNVRDLAIYGAYGAMLSNAGHMWYRHLHVLTARSWRLNTWQMIATKLTADVALFNPVHICCLLSWTNTLRGRPVRVRPPPDPSLTSASAEVPLTRRSAGYSHFHTCLVGPLSNLAHRVHLCRPALCQC